MFNLVELRKLATDKKYSTVRVASKELLSLINEIELLREQLFNAEQQIYRVEKEQLATVTKERDELVADAKRYRWLRDKLFLDGDLEETTIDVSSVWEFGTFLSVDKFIDAALAKLGADKIGEK